MNQKATLESMTRWKTGDIPYRLVYEQHHKALKFEPPRLSGLEDEPIWRLLESKPVIVEFKIIGVRRCFDSGQFYYTDGTRWVIESCLFDTKIAARYEQHRISKLLNKWAEQHQGR